MKYVQAFCIGCTLVMLAMAVYLISREITTWILSLNIRPTVMALAAILMGGFIAVALVRWLSPKDGL